MKIALRTPAAFPDLNEMPGILRRRGVIRLAVFVFLLVLIAFYVPVVHAEGDAPAEQPPAGEVVTSSCETGGDPAQDCADSPADSAECEQGADCGDQAPAEEGDPVDGGEGAVPADTGEEPPPAEGEAAAGDDETDLFDLVDPQFCPDGSVPGDVDEEGHPVCAESQFNLQRAIDDAASAGVDGTIFIEEGAEISDIVFISDIDFNLTISGGWDFETNTHTPGDMTTLNSAIRVGDSHGLIKFENILFGAEATILIVNSNVEITGTAQNDSLSVTMEGSESSSITFYGNGGDDSLVVSGTEENDSFTLVTVPGAVDGKAVYISGLESVSLDGREGHDSFTIDGTDGDDVFAWAINSISLGGQTVSLSGMETAILNGGDGSDSLSVEGTDLDDHFTWTAGSISMDGQTILYHDMETVTLNGGAGIDRLTGPDADTEWRITGADFGEVEYTEASLTHTLQFSSIETLLGRSGNDLFVFSDGAGLTGAIDGGDGENTLDYSAYTTTVIVNLNAEQVHDGTEVRAPNSATGVAGGIKNILNVTGGSAIDILIGTGLGGTLGGGPGEGDIIIQTGPQLAIGALKTFLENFQQEVLEHVFGNAIPLVGDALSKDCDDEEDVCPGAFITRVILAALEDNFDNGIVVDWDDFMDELEAALGEVITVVPSYVLLPTFLATITLGKEEEFEIPFGSGLYGLPLTIGAPGEAVIDLTLNWTFKLSFGTDEDGFFVQPGDLEDTDPRDTLLTVGVEASFLPSDAADGSYTGTVGFFEARILDGANVDGEDLNSKFTATYTITLGDGGAVSGADLFEPPVQGRLVSVDEGDAAAPDGIYLTVKRAAFTLDDGGDFNMGLGAQVQIVWTFNDANTDVDHAVFGEEPLVHFYDVKFDPGPFFTRILRPFIEALQKITKPLQPIVEILLAPVPLLSEFGLGGATLLDFIGAGDEIRKIVHFIDLINGISFGDGDDGSCGEDTTVCGIPIGDGFDVTDPRVEVAEIESDVSWIEEWWSPRWSASAEENGFSAEVSGPLVGGGILSFPILQDPNQVYGMLLGVDAILFQVNIDTALELSYSLPEDDLKYCLYQSLCIQFYGTISVSFGPMEFGYDTFGIRRFLATENPLDLADGFYISDENPLLTFGFDVGVKVSLGLDIYIFSVEAGVKGGVTGEISFFLRDGRIGFPDGIDGRVRASEISYNMAVGPECVFVITGKIDLYLSVYVEVSSDFGLFSITWYENSWDIVRFTLLEFCQSCVGEPPPLAHVDSNGTLILHTGPNAGALQGLYNYSQDEYFVVSPAGGDETGESLSVSAYGYSLPYHGVNSIYADGGAGNDKITIGAGVESDAVLVGGPGDDTLIYKGDGNAELYGEAGNDTLQGGSGENYLYGGRLFADPSQDGDGVTPDPVWVSDGGYWERQFNDVLIGGPGDNFMYGGNGDDKLFGGAGVTEMHGQAGNDVLTAGAGISRMFGGPGNDSFTWRTGGGITEVHGGEDWNSLFIELNRDTLHLDVGAEQDTGRIWVNEELDAILSFDDIHEMNINPGAGMEIVIGDVFTTSLRRINVNTRMTIGDDPSPDTITIFGRSLADDSILVDTQPLDDAGEIQAVHVGFCADTSGFCPENTEGEIEYLLELFVTGSSVADGDQLIVNGGGGDDTFQVRPGPDMGVHELIMLELQGGPGFDTLLGLDIPNIWTMSGTHAGDLNGEFTFAEMDALVGGEDFDTLISDVSPSTFKMTSDFDGILNGELYYFSMQRLICRSDDCTLIGNDTYNFWNLLEVNNGELFQFNGPAGLLALVDELHDAGAFINNGIYNGLHNRLKLALKALAMGRPERAAMEMWMFVWMLDNTAWRGQVVLPGGSTLNACALSAACRVGGILQYESMENLTGGTMDDLFVFTDGMGVTGWIDGSDGTDWLDYSAYSVTIQASLRQGIATGTGGVVNVEMAFGRAPARDHPGQSLLAVPVMEDTTAAVSGKEKSK